MTDTRRPIASAVIIPKSEQFQAPPSKRRKSSTSEDASKRPRLSYDANAGSPPASRELQSPLESSDRSRETAKEPTNDRRKSSIHEERKRGQRLFGGLLSTLSQSTPNGQQKRRLEIEKRQEERVKKQKLDDEARKAEKLAQLKATRQVEQVKFDEKSMQIRHSNMLAMARFLCTQSEPKLYFIPWKLRPEEEERVKNQVAEVEVLIEREVAEFEERHPKVKIEQKEAAETNGEPAIESPSDPAVIDTTNPSTNTQARPSHNSKTEKDTLEEHNGEVVFEHEEDTVIY